MKRNWFVYHSARSAGVPYSSIGAPAVYSSAEKKKLCLADVVWVVEGSKEDPTTFSLVDVFLVDRVDDPPFPLPFNLNRVCYHGEKSLLAAPVPLDAKELKWFGELHKGYITKQKLFVELPADGTILAGLRETSGVSP